MKNLTGVNQVELMSSLEIARVTEKRHDNVMRDIRNLLGQGVNERNFELVVYLDKKGESRPMYNLTKKGALLLASGYNAILREQIIDRWEELEIEKKQGSFEIPQTYAQALLLAAKQTEKLELKEAELKVAAPKVEFYDTVSESNSTFNMSNVAKVLNLGIGRNQLFSFLRDKKILQSDNTPYQQFVDRGWFKLVEGIYTKDGHYKVYLKTVCFQKGLDSINKLYNKIKSK